MCEGHPISEALIAPCGMNCALCSRYLAYTHHLKRSRCVGCRPRDEQCTYLFEKCGGANPDAAGEAAFCFACDRYPCPRIKRMDERYRKNYGMSVRANLERIRDVGLAQFVAEQYATHRCPTCGEVRSVHNGKCFACDPITRLVERRHWEDG
jgi:predicted RNA-binding Zn-ribbon protein involved in translation (DUF1610 family)